MQHYMGAKAIDQTIPTLLEAMRNPGETSETALQALKEVMSVSRVLIIPTNLLALTHTLRRSGPAACSPFLFPVS